MDGTVKTFPPIDISSSLFESNIRSHSTPPAPPQVPLLDEDESLYAKPNVPAARTKQIWAIGGGKGGVGKSLIASSLAISLSRLGHKVVAVDLDLGGANLHTTLGIDLPKQTLGDFLSRRINDIADCVIPTGIPHLDLISGAQDAMNITSLKPSQKAALLKSIRQLDADYIIFDLGAGTGINTLDFFLFSDFGFIVTLPEPTSIENSYRFIKSAYFRHLNYSTSLIEARPLIQMAMDPKNSLQIRSPADLFREVNKVNPDLGVKMKREIEKFQPKLVINQARTPTDVEIGYSIKTVCKKYFGIDLDYMGYLDYDSSVWQAVRRKRPLMVEFPNCKLVSNVDQMVQTMVKQYGPKKMIQPDDNG